MSVIPLLSKINEFILNPIIMLAFAVATLIFSWGIFQFISSETADAKREEGKKKMIYGGIGLFVMFSAYGLIRLILATFSIGGPNYPGF